MLLNKYDFYDIHWAIVMFRWNPLYEHNYEIAKRIKQILDTPQIDNVVPVNLIRKSLSDMTSIHKTDEWYWVTTENVYVYGNAIIDTPHAYQILSKGFAELLRCLEEKDEKRIFDIADALHNVPIILSEHNSKKIKRRIKLEISFYRRKWNHSFLNNELK
jgi:hypothetical protein